MDYQDQEGNPVTLDKLCRTEPEWAANQIRHRDKLQDELDAAKEEIERLQELIAGRYSTGGRSEIDYQNEIARKNAAIHNAAQEIDGMVGITGDAQDVLAGIVEDLEAALKPAPSDGEATKGSEARDR